jgi:hypothetical protein
LCYKYEKNDVVINHAKYMSSPFAFIEFANSKDDDK